MNCRRLFGRERQFDGVLAREGVDPPRTVGQGRGAPALVEDVEVGVGGSGCEGRGTVELLGIAKCLAIDVGECEMGERQIVEIPPRLLRRSGRHHADAEESQLEPIPFAALRPEMSGVVPPLRLVGVVGAVIARETELIPGTGGEKLG